MSADHFVVDFVRSLFETFVSRWREFNVCGQEHGGIPDCGTSGKVCLGQNEYEKSSVLIPRKLPYIYGRWFLSRVPAALCLFAELGCMLSAS